ncbi:hypothetical protein [Streptomyces sp. NBC_01198]|uniref:hypothetical protein n=1 Tax=Streptomyces sp. NBC_01198 TaxID=2903769 RepID=UPI002E158CD2|nr:hypothetical protein OG702_03445 [Streptomyces sp. NBC_01198]
MKKKRAAVRALALAAAAIGLTLASTADANAVTIADYGVISPSNLNFHGCKANIHMGVDAATKSGYARAIFDVPTVDDRGYSCQGWFQRTTNRGSTWTRIGDVHTGGVSSTAWYYADFPAANYVRVCVGDLTTNPNSYTCNIGWAVAAVNGAESFALVRG